MCVAQPGGLWETMTSTVPTSIRTGSLQVSVGPALLIDSSSDGRAIEIWAQSGDTPRILLWESSPGTRQFYDHRNPGSYVKGLMHEQWWPGLERRVWAEIDRAMSARDLHFELSGASSLNTPEIAGRWAVELLAYLEDNWSPAWTITEQALAAAIEAWRKQR